MRDRVLSPEVDVLSPQERIVDNARMLVMDVLDRAIYEHPGAQFTLAVARNDPPTAPPGIAVPLQFRYRDASLGLDVVRTADRDLAGDFSARYRPNSALVDPGGAGDLHVWMVLS